ncbi:MAG: radical SAM protein [Candidatus Omnitrophica bacterium]|nr:radical SAM protein [Candidatus Omnitrophota bacterium]
MNNNELDIILVNPPTRLSSRNIPFSILSLAAYLEDKGKKCEILDVKYLNIPNVSLIEAENYIVDKLLVKPTVSIGFTCLTAEFGCVYRMAQQLRARGYKGFIIAGGHHPTFCPKDFLEEKNIFDYVVLGEGEQTLYELLNAIESKAEVDKIDGLAFYRDGELHKTKPRQLLENLDFFSLPPYHLLDLTYYLQPRTDLIRNIFISGIGIQTTRGCPFNCTFCGNNSLVSANSYTSRIRSRPAEVVVKEIAYLKNKFKIDGFSIEDDMFTLNDRRVIEFSNLLKDRDLRLVWGCQSHVNTFSENMAKNMKEAGCIQVEFGVESGSERILKEMKKGATIKKIKQAFQICKKYSLRSLANFLINTPTEQEEDLAATFRLANSIKATKYSFAVTVPLLGTELYDKYVIPRLKKDEYEISGQRRSYQEITDPRFKLAKHKKNMGLLYVKVRFRYMILGEYLDSLYWFVTHHAFYRKSSRYKIYFRELFLLQINKTYGLLKRVIERLLKRQR